MTSLRIFRSVTTWHIHFGGSPQILGVPFACKYVSYLHAWFTFHVRVFIFLQIVYFSFKIEYFFYVTFFYASVSLSIIILHLQFCICNFGLLSLCTSFLFHTSLFWFHTNLRSQHLISKLVSFCFWSMLLAFLQECFNFLQGWFYFWPLVLFV